MQLQSRSRKTAYPGHNLQKALVKKGVFMVGTFLGYPHFQRMPANGFKILTFKVVHRPAGVNRQERQQDNQTQHTISWLRVKGLL